MATAAQTCPDPANWQGTSAYPLFVDPGQYLAFRAGGRVFGPVKRHFEERAIRLCLDGLSGIRTVIDAPCGPGRLFPYWQSRGWVVTGVDLSAPMVEAAAGWQAQAQVPWRTARGDAFRLREATGTTADLVACVRFCYYFGQARRIELLRSLALASRQYVLVQYKTWETCRGARTCRRTRRKHGLAGKQFCSYAEIAREVEAAGLQCVRIQPVGFLSDRVFVAARQPM